MTTWDSHDGYTKAFFTDSAGHSFQSDLGWMTPGSTVTSNGSDFTLSTAAGQIQSVLRVNPNSTITNDTFDIWGGSGLRDTSNTYSLGGQLLSTQSDALAGGFSADYFSAGNSSSKQHLIGQTLI